MDNNEKFLYKKVNKRYKKVAIYDNHFHDYYVPGHYLISVGKTFKTTRHNVRPDLVPLIAASIAFEEELTRNLVKNSNQYNHSIELTSEQKEAWDNFSKTVEKLKWAAYGPSYAEISRKATQKLIEDAAEIMEVPAVKQAYEEFLLVFKLAVEEKKNS